MGNFKAKDISQYWLEYKEQERPEQFKQLKKHSDAPPAYWLSAEDVNQYLEALDWWDLIKQEQTKTHPAKLDYTTSAINYMDPQGSNLGDIIALISQASKRLPFETVQDVAENYPQEWLKMGKENVPQGIYEHEVAHYRDPRLYPTGNLGYQTYGRQQNPYWLSREMPAMMAEEDFWQSLSERKK